MSGTCGAVDTVAYAWQPVVHTLNEVRPVDDEQSLVIGFKI